MLDLHYWPTPNGKKVTIQLEECGLDYNLVECNIGKGAQFTDAFLSINPNNRMPALVDHAPEDGGQPISVFESGAILVYLAEKFGAFLPTEPSQRAECMSWLFWQMGSAPYLGGGFGHFYAYAPEKWEYPINRFAMEVKRQLDVLDKHLAENEFMVGDEYTIADMAIWPWYGGLVLGWQYDAAEFLQVHTYTNVVRWAEQIWARPAVKRGRMVNRNAALGAGSKQVLQANVGKRSTRHHAVIATP